MKGKFLSNIGFLLILNLLIKGTWILGIDRVVQNTVGSAIYGNYYALLNFTFLFSILIDLGITNYNRRRIAQDRSLLAEHLPGILSLKLLLGLGYFLIVLIIGLLLGYDREQFYFIPILALNQILLSLILYLRSNLGGLHLFRTDSAISVLDRGLMILFCGILLWGLPAGIPFRIEWFVLAQTGAYALTALSAGVAVLKHSGDLLPRWDRNFFGAMLWNSLPYALLVLLMTFYNRVDSVMLERLLPNGSVEVGIYAQGFRILDGISQLGFLSASLLLPIFARNIEKNELKELKGLLSSATRSLIPGAVLVACVCAFHSLSLMKLFYNEHHHEASWVFGALMVSFIPVACSYIYGTLLTAKGVIKQMNLLAGAGMLLNVLLNLILIPSFGAWGASIATLVTQAGTAAAQTSLALSYYPMMVPYKRIIPWPLFLILIVGSGFLLEAMEVPLFLSLLLHTGIGLLGLFLTGLFQFSEGREVLKGIWTGRDGDK
ncbi:MAG: lipopolysaccharide biosynthesis protein [Flavobacteriales bacterium]